jgi:hypothetical protein
MHYPSCLLLSRKVHIIGKCPGSLLLLPSLNRHAHSSTIVPKSSVNCFHSHLYSFNYHRLVRFYPNNTQNADQDTPPRTLRSSDCSRILYPRLGLRRCCRWIRHLQSSHVLRTRTTRLQSHRGHLPPSGPNDREGLRGRIELQYHRQRHLQLVNQRLWCSEGICWQDCMSCGKGYCCGLDD